MKKLIITLFFLSGIKVFTQEFQLTDNNLKQRNDPTKDYIVLDMQGKNKSELFLNAKKYILSQYKGIKNDGYNEIENEQIILDVLSQSARTMWINIQGSNIWKASNRYEINFKDGKIMIRPIFSYFLNTENSSRASIGVLFDSRGKPRKEKGIYFVEDLTNTFIKDFEKGMRENKSNDW